MRGLQASLADLNLLLDRSRAGRDAHEISGEHRLRAGRARARARVLARYGDPSCWSGGLSVVCNGCMGMRVLGGLDRVAGCECPKEKEAHGSESGESQFCACVRARVCVTASTSARPAAPALALPCPLSFSRARARPPCARVPSPAADEARQLAQLNATERERADALFSERTHTEERARSLEAELAERARALEGRMAQLPPHRREDFVQVCARGREGGREVVATGIGMREALRACVRGPVGVVARACG